MKKTDLYSSFRFYYLSLCISICVSFCSVGCASSSRSSLSREHTGAHIQIPTTEVSPRDFAIKKMRSAGISERFIHALEIKSRQKKFLTKDSSEAMISLNVLGFLGRTDYSVHYSETAIKKTRAFIKKYEKTLTSSEQQFHVSKEVIAALLWVETKFGKQVGTFQLPAVYFSLLQANHSNQIKNSLLEMNSRKPSATAALTPPLSQFELEKKVLERSEKKADWALEQLKALDALYLQGFPVFSIKSSYAGAFGFSQFIPSSYRDLAVSHTKGRANLFNMKDAILSVGNFLSKKGWKDSDVTTQTTALFEYNRARGYGDVILKIADATRPSLSQEHQRQK